MPVLTGRLGRAGDRDQAGLGLDQHVVGLALLERAAATEAGHVDDDQFASGANGVRRRQNRAVRRHPGARFCRKTSAHRRSAAGRCRDPARS